MNLGHVLFSPNGRIGQQEYWIGILILVGSNVFLTWIPLLGLLVWLALIYMGICIYGKRLHDIGKSAWIHAGVWALQLVIGMIGFAMAGGAIMAALASGAGDQAGLAAVGRIGQPVPDRRPRLPYLDCLHSLAGDCGG